MTTLRADREVAYPEACFIDVVQLAFTTLSSTSNDAGWTAGLIPNGTETVDIAQTCASCILATDTRCHRYS